MAATLVPDSKPVTQVRGQVMNSDVNSCYIRFFSVEAASHFARQFWSSVGNSRDCRQVLGQSDPLAEFVGLNLTVKTGIGGAHPGTRMIHEPDFHIRSYPYSNIPLPESVNFWLKNFGNLDWPVNNRADPGDLSAAQIGPGRRMPL